MSLRVTWRGIHSHPLARHHPWRALWNVLSWQVVSRLQHRVDARFVEGTRLRVSRHMTGLTGNVYFGLHEHESMAFVLHLLQEDDLFVDIGANAGSYSVLAAGVRASTVVAIEPDATALAALHDNLSINQLQQRVQVLPIVIGSTDGAAMFSTGLDTINHVLRTSEIDQGVPHRRCDQLRLDHALRDHKPHLIKIDVEGHEHDVLAGADEVLAGPQLLALIIELTESGYEAIADRLADFGFRPATYDADRRRLEPVTGKRGGNTLFVRATNELVERISRKRPVRIHPLSCSV